MKSLSATLLLVLSVATCIAALSLQIYLVYEVRQLSEQQESAYPVLLQLASTLDAAAKPQNFVHTLPDASSVAASTRQVQSHFAKRGIEVGSMLIARHQATDTALPYTEWKIEALGAYAQVKAAIVAVLNGVPALQVQTVQFTKESPQGTSAKLSLIQWHAPATPTTGSFSGGVSP